MMHLYPEIPERPDLTMGGTGNTAWIDIDFLWEREGVCVLLDQPERHSAYTRRIDLARDSLLRSLGLEVARLDRYASARQRRAFSARIRRTVRARRAEQRPCLEPVVAWNLPPRRAPQANVNRRIAWLRGDEGAAPTVPAACRIRDRELVTWDYDPGVGTLELVPIDLFIADEPRGRSARAAS